MKILICPLNWGIGHATRCVPVIKKLIWQGHDVTVASDGNALMVLKSQFPGIKNKELAPLIIKYSTFFFIGLVYQLPRLLTWIKKDRERLHTILSEESYDVIISDSRPAIFSNRIKSILLISQPNPIIPWFYGSGLVKLLLNTIYKKYHEIWIPDIKGLNSLSGRLIKISDHKKVRHLGWLSRLEIKTISIEIPGKILAIISGPEPSRSDFEHRLDLMLPAKDVILIGGDLNSRKSTARYIPYLEPAALARHIESSEYIISRGGYSSLMDLAFSNKKIILVPTPGQTEQQYLACRLVEKKYAVRWDMKLESWSEVKSKSDQAMRFDLKHMNRDNDKFLEEVLEQLDCLI